MMERGLLFESFLVAAIGSNDRDERGGHLIFEIIKYIL